MRTATFLGRGFSVVTHSAARPVGPGISRRSTASRISAGMCAPVRSRVLDLEIPGSAARAVITAECARAGEDDCDVIVLPCRRHGGPGRRHQRAHRHTSGGRGCRRDQHGAIAGVHGTVHQFAFRIRSAALQADGRAARGVQPRRASGDRRSTSGSGLNRGSRRSGGHRFLNHRSLNLNHRSPNRRRREISSRPQPRISKETPLSR